MAWLIDCHLQSPSRSRFSDIDHVMVWLLYINSSMIDMHGVAFRVLSGGFHGHFFPKLSYNILLDKSPTLVFHQDRWSAKTVLPLAFLQVFCYGRA